jgi:hypothetical protein
MIRNVLVAAAVAAAVGAATLAMAQGREPQMRPLKVEELRKVEAFRKEFNRAVDEAVARAQGDDALGNWIFSHKFIKGILDTSLIKFDPPSPRKLSELKKVRAELNAELDKVLKERRVAVNTPLKLGRVIPMN